MSEQTAMKNRYRRPDTFSLTIFYILAFGISWLGFVPSLVSSLGLRWFHSPLWQAGLIFPGVGPAVAAGIASARLRSDEKSDAMPASRWRRSFFKQVPLRWWAITVALSVGIMLVASLLSFRIDHIRIISKASASSVVLFSVFCVAANPLEEIGWRGFAQTQIQRTHTALRAALIVGALSAVWHVPLFLIHGGPMSMSQTLFWAWAAGVIPQAILLAWLYNRTGHSLATTSVFHILGNITGDIFHSSTAMVSVLRMVAVLAIFWTDGFHLGEADVYGDRPISTRSSSDAWVGT